MPRRSARLLPVNSSQKSSPSSSSFCTSSTTPPSSTSSTSYSSSSTTSPLYDIYLGGASSSSHSWRHDIAVPTLKRHGLTYCASDSAAQSSSSHIKAATPESLQNDDAHFKLSSDDLQQRRTSSIGCNALLLNHSPHRRQNSCDTSSSNCNPSDDRGSSSEISSHRSSFTNRRVVANHTNHQSSSSDINHCATINENHQNEHTESSSHDTVDEVDFVSRKTSDLQYQEYKTTGAALLDEIATSTDTARIDQCRVLLFVITNNTRGLSDMTLVSYCVYLSLI